MACTSEPRENLAGPLKNIVGLDGANSRNGRMNVTQGSRFVASFAKNNGPRSLETMPGIQHCQEE